MIQEYLSTKSEDRSSILDVSVYRECCLRASQDENIFRQFRTLKDIAINIESVDLEIGRKYLSVIKSEYPFLMDCFSEFIKNDLIGNPRLVYFPEIGNISPTTLRYVKILGELVSLFGPMNGWNVAEIGGGYGGQCRILSSHEKLNSYTLVDLPETLLLANRYLDQYRINNVSYLSINNLVGDVDYDLVVSNYAFTECQKNVQDVYLEKIIRKSKNGYMICNFTSHYYNVSSYKAQELIDVLKGYGLSVRVLEETPYCGGPPDLERNILVVWSNRGH